MSPAAIAAALATLSVLATCSSPVAAMSLWPPAANQTRATHVNSTFGSSKRYEGSSDQVDLKYYMGPVLTTNINVSIIWYGNWMASQKRIIRAFIGSLSAQSAPKPSVAEWWRTVSLYTDQTGANVSRSVRLAAEKNDHLYSHGKSLTRLGVQSVIKDAVTARVKPLPITHGGMYLLLTSPDVTVDDFCTSVCGFHYFTFPSIVGYTLPFAWVGNSQKLCPGRCAYPFAVPDYIPGLKPEKSPNGDVGVDGMVIVIGHEMAEMASNPLINSWYAGGNPLAPVEIADLCEGIYGTGGGGSYTGQMLKRPDNATYNMNGNGRQFLGQWIWNNNVRYCTGPNALD